MKNNTVLKYNANWQVIGRDSLKKAIKKVYKGIAVFMDKNTGEFFNFENWLKLDPTDNFIILQKFGKIRRPQGLICIHYSGMGMSPQQNIEPRFSRWNVYVRDDGKCCFCGKSLPYEHGGFTFDHLHPKSKGGDKDWLNIVLSCRACNHKKGNKILEESGLKLLKKPYKPQAKELRNKAIKIRQEILLKNT